MTGPAVGGEVAILRLGAQGDGVAETAGAAKFVPLALPGERWHLDGEGRGQLVEGTRSAERADPPCRHFGVCGGCAAQHMSDPLYRRWKEGIVAEAFRHRGLEVEVEPLIPIPPRSRRRAVLGAALKAHRAVLIGFREEGRHTLVDIAECVVLDPEIVAVLEPLRDIARLLLSHAPKDKKRADERNARITVTRLDAGLDVSIEAGRAVLPAEISARLASIAERARLVRLAVDGDAVVVRGRPVLTVSGVETQPPPSVFLQAVPEAEARLVRLVTDALPARMKRAADLFCGVGTFTFALARRGEVLALDGDRKAVAALDYAARRAPGLKRIETRVRDLLREPLSRTELAAFDAVVFDPPRAGASEQAAALARSAVPLVVAVSCNPATLARDAKILVGGGYRLSAVTPVDQFVWSPHVEAVAVFRRT